MIDRIPDETAQTPESQPVSLPLYLAENYVAGTLANNETKIFHGDKTTIYHCLEQEVVLPGVGNALLEVNYRKFHKQKDAQSDSEQMCFDFVQPDEEGDKGSIAQMHWFISPKPDPHYPCDLELSHREVNPEYRDRRGIGRHLYQYAETWARQVANAKGTPLTLAASMGQTDVIRWFTKLGYEPYPQDRELFEQIVAHPELFGTETHDYGMDNGRKVLRENMLYRKASRMPVRLWMRKVIEPG